MSTKPSQTPLKVGELNIKTHCLMVINHAIEMATLPGVIGEFSYTYLLFLGT